jgi:flagellar hook-length control protein FliK
MITDVSYSDNSTEKTVSEPELRTDYASYSRIIRQTDENSDDIPKISLGLSEQSDDRQEVREEPEDNTSAAAEQLVTAERTNTDTEEIVGEDEEQTASSVNYQTAEQILEKLRVRSDNGTDELTVKLNPRSLGEISVKISRDESGSISVTLSAQNSNVSGLLSAHSEELAQMLTAKGCTVNDVTVVNPAESGQTAEFDMNGNQNTFNFRQQGMGRHNSFKVTADDDDDDDDSSVSAISADTEYISKEARLWTTA